MVRIKSICAATAGVVGGLYLAVVIILTLTGDSGLWTAEAAPTTLITALWAACSLVGSLPRAKRPQAVQLGEAHDV